MRLMLAVVLTSFAVAVASAAPGPWRMAADAPVEVPSTRVAATARRQAAAPTLAQVTEAFAATRSGSPVPLSLEADQAAWLADLRQAENENPQPDLMFEGRLQTLLQIRARDAGIRAMRVPGIEALSGDCITAVLDGCLASMGGHLKVRDGSVLYWQLQSGSTEETGITDGIILLSAIDAAPGSLGPVAWSFEGARFDPPLLVSNSTEDGQVYVAVPGVHAGSGSHNADLLFRWTPASDRPLTQIDNWSWRDALDERLPPGLGVWQGVRFDYRELMAVTPLWAPDDGNCCPSGGWAILGFEIVGDRLVLDTVTLRPGAR